MPSRFKARVYGIRSPAFKRRVFQANLSTPISGRFLNLDVSSVQEKGQQRVDARLFEIRSEIRRPGEADIPVRQTVLKAMGVLELLETTWKASSDGQKSQIAKALFPEGMSFGSGQSVGTPSNADLFGLCVLFDGGEKQLASLTGFRWNTFVAWMQGVASLWESTQKLCWRAKQASETKNPSNRASHA